MQPILKFQISSLSLSFQTELQLQTMDMKHGWSIISESLRQIDHTSNGTTTIKVIKSSKRRDFNMKKIQHKSNVLPKNIMEVVADYLPTEEITFDFLANRPPSLQPVHRIKMVYDPHDFAAKLEALRGKPSKFKIYKDTINNGDEDTDYKVCATVTVDQGIEFMDGIITTTFAAIEIKCMYKYINNILYTPKLFVSDFIYLYLIYEL